MSGWSIACAMQKLLIAMLIFQQLLSGVSGASPIPFDAVLPDHTDQTERKRRTKVSITVL